MEFRTAQFEGPLELLLSLIDEKRLDITDIALGEVTEQYVRYVHEHRDTITLAHLADFLSVAARLLLLKSRSLLPLLVPPADDDDEGEIDLATQLALYKRYSAAAQSLGDLWSHGRRSFVRDVSPRRRQVVFTPPEGVDTATLRMLLGAVIDEIPKIDQLERQHLRDVIALEERITTLTRLIRERGDVSFGQLLRQATSRTDAIVSFLAVLELVKQDAISVRQDHIDDDIVLSGTVSSAC